MQISRTKSSMTRGLTVMALAALLQACQAPPTLPSWPRTGGQAPAAGQPEAPEAAADAAAQPAAPAVVAAREGEVPGLLTAVRNNLDAGEAAAASADLERVLAFDAQHKAAGTLMRQLREDPQELYGRESFPYRVQPGDTLATIAQRYMNDRDQFYGLARYNGIEVPRQLQVGQTIRIPGKAPRVIPPPVAQPAPAPAPTPAPPPPPAAAPAPAPQAAPAPAVVAPDPRLEHAKAERERKAAIAKWTRQARAAMARQDVCSAIAAWSEVLKLDPSNRTAALEREKALDLKHRLPGAKC